MIRDCPKVRSGLSYVPQVMDGKRTVVVKDSMRMQYFRFGEVEAWLMQHMDGTRSLSDLAEGLRHQFGVDASAPTLEPFVARLKELHLAERSPEERRILLADSLRRERRLKLQGHGNTLFRMRFSLGDPDRLFDRLVRPLGFFWTPGFVVLSIAAFVVYLAIVIANWPAFSQGIAAMYTAEFYTVASILMMYGATVVILGIHEVGHGLTCKRFGGEVHEIGAMFLYFMPAFFCNVNDAWMFEKRSHRLWVTFAGGWIQLLLASIATVLWVLTEPDTFLHELAFLSLLIGGGLSLLLNYNPLLPLDGYYALMDWLEIPNLRQRSSAYLSAVLRRPFFPGRVEVPRCTERERRIFLTYGSLAWAYTALVLGVFALFVARLLVGWFGAWGWVLVAGIVWMLAGTELRRGARAGAAWTRGALLRRSALARRFGGGMGGVLAVVLVASFIPWTVQVRGIAEIEPGARVWLRSPDAGRVTRLAAAEGTPVVRGQVLAVVVDPELELDLVRARAAVRVLERQRAAWTAVRRPAESRRSEMAAAAAQDRLVHLEQRVAALTLIAPFDGRVVTPRLPELAGSAVEKGDSLFELWSDDRPLLRVRLSERDAAGVSRGDRIAVRFPALAGRTIATRIEAVGAAASDGLIDLIAPIPVDLPAALRVGMEGRAKIETERITVAAACMRALRRLTRADLLL